MIDCEFRHSLPTQAEINKRFLDAVNKFPRISIYWEAQDENLERILFKPKLFESDAWSLSSGELLMANFFKSVFSHKTDFDLVYAANTLGGAEKAVILDWFSNPYMP